MPAAQQAAQQATPLIIDQHGNPLAPQAASRSFSPGTRDGGSQSLSAWTPFVQSADASWLPEREIQTGRAQDLARTHGYTAGAIRTWNDNVVGAGWRLSAKPDWEALGLTREQGEALAKQIETAFRGYANDPGFHVDATRKTNLAGLLGQACRSALTRGEYLATPLWLPLRRGANWATAIQMIDPERLSTPRGMSDSPRLRAGVEMNRLGAPIAYHIARTHPTDWMGGVNGLTGGAPQSWVRVPRETAWGRRRVMHWFPDDEVGQTRGKPLINTAIVPAKLLERFTQAEQEAAVLNAMFAMYIKTTGDPTGVADAMGAEADGYHAARASWHSEMNFRFQGAKVPLLFTGEDLEFKTPSRPSAQFEPFVSAGLRQIAAGLGMSYEELARDYTKTNYSSARAALLASWKSFMGMRARLATHFMDQVYGLWLEEALNRGEFDVPAGAPRFEGARAAWCRCRWIGPGRGWIDPVKEIQAAEKRLALGISTMEQEAAEQGGDWEDIAEQRAREVKKYTELGLRLPSWAGGAAAPGPTAEETQTNDALESASETTETETREAA